MRVDSVRLSLASTPLQTSEETAGDGQWRTPGKKDNNAFASCNIPYGRGGRRCISSTPPSPTNPRPTPNPRSPIKCHRNANHTHGGNRYPQRPHNGQIIRRRTILRLHRLPRRLAPGPLDHRTSPIPSPSPSPNSIQSATHTQHISSTTIPRSLR